MECTLYLTDYCNLKCSYCYQGNNKKATFLNSEKLGQALDFIVANNPEGEKIYLNFLGGEPLLNKDLIYEALDIINNKHSKYSDLFEYSITTNCILLDDNLVAILKENNFHIKVSIDGDKETHNLNRKSIDNEDKYEFILDNVKKIKEQNLNHSIRMTVTQNNIHLMYKNVLYFYNIGFEKYCLGLNSFANWDNEDLQELNNQLQKIEDFYIQKLENNENIYIDLFDGKFKSILLDRKPLFCSAGSQGHISINSNGELYPCTYVINDDKWKIGTITEGLNSQKFHESVNESVCKKNKCTDCDIKFTCHGRKCGFLNYVQTKYLNKCSENLCNIERIVYNHNKSILAKLYKKRNQRLISMLHIAENHNLKLSECFESIIKSI